MNINDAISQMLNVCSIYLHLSSLACKCRYLTTFFFAFISAWNPVTVSKGQKNAHLEGDSAGPAPPSLQSMLAFIDAEESTGTGGFRDHNERFFVG